MRGAGAFPDGVDQYRARTDQVLWGAVAGVQSAQPESGKSPETESGTAGGAAASAGSDRIAQRADSRIHPADREDRQGKLSASSATGTGEGSGDADNFPWRSSRSAG